jgi:hypothetical protein
MFDIIFISYQEPNAEENWKNLSEKFPRAQRIHGVKGIHQAHLEAAKKASSEMFWVVDGDARLVPDFKFEYDVEQSFKDFVHVWRCKNPVNDLVYGYGGVKLLPRDLTLNMDVTKPDMTTSISSKFKPVKILSNITDFNSDPFSAWKGGFRECVKLSSKVIDRQKDAETEYRLDVWCSVGKNKLYGKYVLDGANDGRKYGSENMGDTAKLKLINDFDWLKKQFEEKYGQV